MPNRYMGSECWWRMRDIEETARIEEDYLREQREELAEYEKKKEEYRQFLHREHMFHVNERGN